MERNNNSSESHNAAVFVVKTKQIQYVALFTHTAEGIENRISPYTNLETHFIVIAVIKMWDILYLYSLHNINY